MNPQLFQIGPRPAALRPFVIRDLIELGQLCERERQPKDERQITAIRHRISKSALFKSGLTRKQRLAWDALK
jgi:hypothetical protein